MINITPIIEMVIAVICVAITSWLIPYIKRKTTKEQYDYLSSVVKTAVYAAEVLLNGDGRGEQKRDYVLNYVKKICEAKNMTYDESEVRQMLEKSWTELTAQTKE